MEQTQLYRCMHLSLSQLEKDEEARFFILLDDVISDQRLKYDEALMELFVAGRHYKLFVLITTQYAKAITPTLRGNTDYCFMMKTIQQRQLEALWEDFGSFLTKDAFAAVINQYTEDNECLVVNTCPECEVDPLQMLSWWKAVDPGEFKMGSKEYWRTAMLGASLIPPHGQSNSATELLIGAECEEIPRPLFNSDLREPVAKQTRSRQSRAERFGVQQPLHGGAPTALPIPEHLRRGASQFSV
jgi:hypothetical protein